MLSSVNCSFSLSDNEVFVLVQIFTFPLLFFPFPNTEHLKKLLELVTRDHVPLIIKSCTAQL